MSSGREEVERFQRRLLRNIEYHEELTLALYGKTRRASLEAMLSEQFVMSIAVLWEAFVNDLIVAYVVAAPSKYLKQLESRIKQSTNERYGKTVAANIRFKKPKAFNKVKALEMIDPRGWNIRTKKGETLSSRANDLLTAKYAKKFSLGSDDNQMIEILTMLRNYLAHRSTGARSGLRNVISNIDCNGTNAPLADKLGDIGHYLKRCVDGKNTRAIFIAKRFIDIAEKLK